MSKTLTVLITVVIVAAIVLWVNKSSLFEAEEEYIPSEYEVNLIEYFKEIALNTEYDDNPERVIKWRQPMSLFVYMEKDSEEQMEVVRNTLAKINELVSDGFKVSLTEDITKSNAVLYLCNKDRVRELAPKFYELLEDDLLGDYTGMTYVEFKWSNFVITKALIFIDEEATIDEQKSAIVEEVTQSIGLLNDSKKYSDSVFYEDEDGIENMDYSQMDRDIISLLYSDKMMPGFRDKTVEITIKRILKTEKSIGGGK